MGEIREIAPKRDKAAKVAKMLRRAVASQILSQGEDIAGFALVTWDHRGDTDSSYLTSSGPVSRSFMPILVKDALDRHVTIRTAEEVQTEEIFPDGPA